MSLISAVANPRLEISLGQIAENSAVVSQLCHRFGIQLVGVTKGCAGLTQVAQAMIEGGAIAIGDSQIANLARLAEDQPSLQLQMIRTPMLSQAKKTVSLANLSLNTQLSVLHRLSEEAQQAGRCHKVILMLELGDDREGVWEEDIEQLAVKADQLEGLELVGLGGTVGCRNLSYPTPQQIAFLLDTSRSLEIHLGRTIEVISLGGSSVLPLLQNGLCPTGLTQLRIGEAILLGTDGVLGHHIRGTSSSAFELVAEIIESRGSPRQATASLSATGKRHIIAAVGYQDTYIPGLTVCCKTARIEAATSDHLILEIDGEETGIVEGSEVRFSLNYRALVQLCASQYVSKCFTS